MKNQVYTVYVHLLQDGGKVLKANCSCKAGAGGCCKHVAATLFQIHDFVELGLSTVPDDKSCIDGTFLKIQMCLTCFCLLI